MPKQTLQLLEVQFTIHSFAEDDNIPSSVLSAPIFFIGKTYEELSIVCPSDIPLASTEHESGWMALEILGPLAFSLTGILSNISGVLAEADISIFSISTFDTDYILLKEELITKAVEALRKNDYKVVT